MPNLRKKIPGFNSPLARAPRFMPREGESLFAAHQKRRMVQQLEGLVEDARMAELHHAETTLREALEKLRVALVADAQTQDVFAELEQMARRQRDA